MDHNFLFQKNNNPITKGGARGVMVIVVGNGHGQHEFKSLTRLIALFT